MNNFCGVNFLLLSFYSCIAGLSELFFIQFSNLGKEIDELLILVLLISVRDKQVSYKCPKNATKIPEMNPQSTVLIYYYQSPKSLFYCQMHIPT